VGCPGGYPEVLGKGSFGKAYLVRNTEVDELCVVKQMETSTMDPKERNEAVKEAMLLKKMNHPNIISFKEVFITRKGRLCIVMAYADGGDVHKAIKRREGALVPEAQVLEWIVQTSFAMKHVHEMKVLHRDLKTQNIFLMASGAVKLGDFGIARVLDATKDYAKTMVGTPYYLSPEIIEDRPYNFKSDIWSLGVVLYEMTTLKHPFDADSLVVLASKILKDQYPPPDSMYSEDLVAMITSMLKKDSQMRPSIYKILCSPFLQECMQSSNTKYGLGLDLSDFEKAAEASAGSRPSLAERRRQEAAAPSMAAAPAERIAAPLAVPSDAHGDTVLIGTVAPAVKSAQQAAAPPEEERAEEAADDDEYEEEFEDYSGSEDAGENNAQAELRASVKNLKIGAEPAREAEGGSRSSAPAMPGSAASTALPAEGASNPGIAGKAESLRRYLRSQMPENDFLKVHALVRASGEATPEELAKRVGAVIGSEKAPELLTLFQLLCFLENVSAETAQAS